MKKKAAPAWYIATTHYLTAGFIPGIVCGAIGAFLIHTFTINSPFLSQAIFACLVPIASYAGVRYSAAYLRRAYVVNAAARIATISSFYYAAIQVAGVIALIYFAVSSSFPEGIVLVMVIAFTQALSGFLVFYSMSVVCIKDDPIDAIFSDPNVPSALFPSHYQAPLGAPTETTTKPEDIQEPIAATPPPVPPPAVPKEVASTPSLIVPSYTPPAAIVPEPIVVPTTPAVATSIPDVPPRVPPSPPPSPPPLPPAPAV